MAQFRRNLLAIIGPGVLVAATGVGAGDLAAGAFTGRELGTAVLWAVLVGAGFKYVLSEGLTRWQLVTGETIVEGGCTRLGPVVRYGFLAFLLLWSFFVGVALMSACGVATHALYVGFTGGPLVDPSSDKVIFGIVHSLVAIVLVWFGGYRVVEKVMQVLIAIMFVTVVATAIAVGPEWGEVARGLVWPVIPPGGVPWTVALIGGVGGTLTIVCYGYWIREEDRTSPEDLGICKIDLATGYGMTALFGIAMVVIGHVSSPETEAKGASLVVEIGRHLGESLGSMGPVAKWAFLAGAWGAVFSSLLGVWQCVPYLFADYWAFTFAPKESDPTPIVEDAPAGRVIDTTSPIYRSYLVGLGLLPMLALARDFKQVQLWNSVLGAMVVPLLAVALLLLNGRTKWIGERYRNGPWSIVALSSAIAFFLYASYLKFLVPWLFESGGG